MKVSLSYDSDIAATYIRCVACQLLTVAFIAALFYYTCCPVFFSSQSMLCARGKIYDGFSVKPLHFLKIKNVYFVVVVMHDADAIYDLH